MNQENDGLREIGIVRFPGRRQNRSNSGRLRRRNLLSQRQREQQYHPPHISTTFPLRLRARIYRTTVRSSALTPFHIIWTPMQTRMKDDMRKMTFIAESPSARPMRSANR